MSSILHSLIVSHKTESSDLSRERNFHERWDLFWAMSAVDSTEAPWSPEFCNNRWFELTPKLDSPSRHWNRWKSNKHNQIIQVTYLFDCEILCSGSEWLLNVMKTSTVSPHKNTADWFRSNFALISIILIRDDFEYQKGIWWLDWAGSKLEATLNRCECKQTKVFLRKKSN